MYDITVVGHLTIDRIKREFAVSYIEAPGGSSFYTSLTTSMLDLKTAIVSKVGMDYPMEYLELLRSRGIDTSFINVCSTPTTKVELRYDKVGRTLRVTNICERISLNEFPKLERLGAVHIGAVVNEVMPEVYDSLHNKASLLSMDVQGVVRLIGAAGYVRLTKPNDILFLGEINLIKATEKELLYLTGTQNLKSALKRMREICEETIIAVTKGELGCLLFTHRGEVFEAPAYPVYRVSDTTGAGDALIGGIISSILKGENLDYALALGIATASYCVEKESAYKFSLGSDFKKRVQWVFSRIRKVAI